MQSERQLLLKSVLNPPPSLSGVLAGKGAAKPQESEARRAKPKHKCSSQ